MFVAFGMFLVIQFLAADREDGTLLRAKATPGGVPSYLLAKLVNVSLTVGGLPGDGRRARQASWSTASTPPAPQRVGHAGLGAAASGLAATQLLGAILGSRCPVRRAAGYIALLVILPYRRVRHLLPTDRACRSGCNGWVKPPRSTGSVSGMRSGAAAGRCRRGRDLPFVADPGNRCCAVGVGHSWAGCRASRAASNGSARVRLAHRGAPGQGAATSCVTCRWWRRNGAGN